MPDALTAGNVHLLRQTTPTDLRSPVGQHIRRTILATDRRVPDGSGVALGVMLSVAFFVCLAVIVVVGWPVLHAGFGVVQGYVGVLGNVLRVAGL